MVVRAGLLWTLLAAPALLPATAVAQEPVGAYALGPGDMVELKVYPDESLNRRLRVRPDGTMDMPLLGPMAVSGRTESEAAAEVRRALTGDYYKEPQVELEVVEHVAHRAYVLGAVREPGSYPVHRDDRLLDLVQRAGGPGEGAGGFAYLFANSSGGPARIEDVTRVSLMRMLQGGDLSQNVRVPNGATVYVFGQEDVFILGEVKNAGSYPIDERVTLLRAITLAGGLAERANADRVSITRASTGERRTVDVDKIMDGSAPDPELHPGDLIFVPTRFF